MPSQMPINSNLDINIEYYYNKGKTSKKRSSIGCGKLIDA